MKANGVEQARAQGQPWVRSPDNLEILELLNILLVTDETTAVEVEGEADADHENEVEDHDLHLDHDDDPVKTLSSHQLVIF